MAAMEKINFPPLIAELTANSALYNQWYNDAELKYGTLSTPILMSWMVEVVQPIVLETSAVNSAPEKVHEVVKALYLESLKLIGSGLAIRYKEEYKSAWLLLMQLPHLVLKFPVKIISLLHDVLSNLHTYAPAKTVVWCQLMKNSSFDIKTIEDFKIAGRIYAWKCGLAHLRSRLKEDFQTLSEELKHTILKNLSEEATGQIFEFRWSTHTIKFEGVHGGFKGSEGFFEHPPKLAQIDEYLFATDSINNYALFADQFGKVLLPANTVDSNYILSNSKPFDSVEKWLGKGKEQIDAHKISSIVTTKDTLAFTLQNSYFIYLFSIANE